MSCDVQRFELTAVFTRRQCNLRDLQEHENRVSHLKYQNKYWSRKWGVNGESALSTVPGFDVMKCFLHDPMHLVLEGVAKTELKKLLYIFVYGRKYVTLTLLVSAHSSEYTHSRNL